MIARLMVWVGAIGSGTVSVCCFTALLPTALGALGLGAMTGLVYRDSVLLPLLALFIVILGAGLWIKKRQS